MIRTLRDDFSNEYVHYEANFIKAIFFSKQNQNEAVKNKIVKNKIVKE